MPLFSSSKGGEREQQKELVHTSLTELCATPNYRDIDNRKVARIAETVRVDNSLLDKIIKFLKAKIKESDENGAVVAMEVLDRCMSEIGYICQHQAKHKILPRLLKMAEPKGNYPAEIQSRSRRLIWRWADLYGKDVRLSGYMTAYQELRAAGVYVDDERQGRVADNIVSSEFYQSAIRGSRGVQSVPDDDVPYVASTIASSLPPTSITAPSTASAPTKQRRTVVTVAEAADMEQLLRELLDSQEPGQAFGEALLEVGERCQAAKRSIQQQVQEATDDASLARLLALNERMGDTLKRFLAMAGPPDSTGSALSTPAVRGQPMPGSRGGGPAVDPVTDPVAAYQSLFAEHHAVLAQARERREGGREEYEDGPGPPTYDLPEFDPPPPSHPPPPLHLLPPPHSPGFRTDPAPSAPTLTEAPPTFDLLAAFESINSNTRLAREEVQQRQNTLFGDSQPAVDSALRWVFEVSTQAKAQLKAYKDPDLAAVALQKSVKGLAYMHDLVDVGGIRVEAPAPRKADDGLGHVMGLLGL
mmetsp:Transcript_41752/g.98029  ORF Transcript_41752/g.98029 Transcript_41752/m.98029 type:complete len:530 (+) Transcript_41752:311-1900(+)